MKELWKELFLGSPISVKLICILGLISWSAAVVLVFIILLKIAGKL